LTISLRNRSFATFIFRTNFFNFIYFRCCEVRIISDVESYCSSCSDADIVNESNDESLDDEGCWMEICDEVDDNEKDFIPRFKMSSSVQSTHLLSNDSINQLLIGDHCVKGRKCMACPNDRDCREMFGTVSEARERIRNFRKKYWNGKNDPGNIFDRRKQLFVDIDAMKVYNKETKQFIIEYKIEGRFVCKSFFHVSASK